MRFAVVVLWAATLAALVAAATPTVGKLKNNDNDATGAAGSGVMEETPAEESPTTTISAHQRERIEAAKTMDVDGEKARHIAARLRQAKFALDYALKKNPAAHPHPERLNADRRLVEAQATAAPGVDYVAPNFGLNENVTHIATLEFRRHHAAGTRSFGSPWTLKKRPAPPPLEGNAKRRIRPLRKPKADGASSASASLDANATTDELNATTATTTPTVVATVTGMATNDSVGGVGANTTTTTQLPNATINTTNAPPPAGATKEEEEDELIGEVRIALFGHAVPQTVENFRALCTGEYGYGYEGSLVHRILQGFLVQMGDFTSHDGLGGHSIYGRYFPDENFKLKHRTGAVAMANRGKDTNGAQFYVALGSYSALNGKNVVFGHVIEGFHDTVRFMASPQVRTDAVGHPLTPIYISGCRIKNFHHHSPNYNETEERQSLEARLAHLPRVTRENQSAVHEESLGVQSDEVKGPWIDGVDPRPLSKALRDAVASKSISLEEVHAVDRRRRRRGQEASKKQRRSGSASLSPSTEGGDDDSAASAAEGADAASAKDAGARRHPLPDPDFHQRQYEKLQKLRQAYGRGAEPAGN